MKNKLCVPLLLFLHCKFDMEQEVILLFYLQQYHIDGHYDVDQRVIYLHLLSAYDAGQLTSLCKKASDEISQSVSIDGEVLL